MSGYTDSGRIAKRFAALKSSGRGGLVTFLTAGDPNQAVFEEILLGLPAAGADLIELGMPFSDPMADGPAIQAASLRALKAGADMKHTLALVRRFRQANDETPIILMGYYNPIYSYGVEDFLAHARAAGVDGLIVVDLPPEEDSELCVPALEAGLNFIRLATPTTDDARLPVVLHNTNGFVYYVSVLGITGTVSARYDHVHEAVKRLRRHTDLPIAVGFGLKTARDVREITKSADAAVVGTAIVDQVANGLDDSGRPAAGLAGTVLDFVRGLAGGLKP